MSDIPPSGEPPQQNQPSYAPYYRPGAGSYGTADKLQALSDGYFGLSKVFVINILIVLASRLVTLTLGPDEALIALFAIMFVLLVAVAALSYGPNKRIGEGKDWPPSNALIASILMGLNSALCCGIIGYVVMQSIASKEM